MCVYTNMIQYIIKHVKYVIRTRCINKYVNDIIIYLNENFLCDKLASNYLEKFISRDFVLTVHYLRYKACED